MITSNKTLIFADKSVSIYELTKSQCDKLLQSSLMTTFKKADRNIKK